MSISSELGEQREAGVGAETIRYRERGEGPPIVFVHGAFVNGDLWRKVVPLLAEGRRCITPDWPLGAHEVPVGDRSLMTPPGLARLMNGFLAALELDDVTIIANDTGGGLAQILVTEHPERIGALVLTSCDAFSNFPPHAVKPVQPLFYIPGFAWLFTQGLRPIAARRAFMKTVAKQPVPEDVLDSYAHGPLTSAGVRRDLARLLRGLRPRHTRRAAEKLADFGKPALIAWSGEDRFFPVKHGRRLAEIIPGARFELIEGSRSFSPEDQPERVARLIADFVPAGDESPAPAVA